MGTINLYSCCLWYDNRVVKTIAVSRGVMMGWIN